MTNRRLPVPLAPLMVSAVLLALAWWYVGGRTDLAPKGAGVLRLVTWDVRPPPGADLEIDSLASALAALNADAIALQGLVGEPQALQLAGRLGPGWRGETIRGPAGAYLAVLAGPTMEITAYRLITTNAGDALALAMRHNSGRDCRVVSLDAGTTTGDERVRTSYASGVLTWCDTRQGGLTVLAGPLEVDGATEARLADRFIVVGSAAESRKELHIEPATTTIAEAGVMGRASVAGVPGSPVLVDVAYP